MKFNMGCGCRKLPGYVNVDAEAAAEPDQVWDLEVTPWPWADGCAEEIRFIHSLEHMGANPKVFLKIMQEVYRIAAPGCEVTIHVPHPRHENFLSDPTHVRAIGPDTMRLFDRRLNDQWLAKNVPNTPLARYLGVDFHLKDFATVIDEPYAGQRERGEITDAALALMVRQHNNVASEYRLTLIARKP